ncbi:MAG: hypothetical protein AAF745_04225 [Planctomycetota bacterium]
MTRLLVTVDTEEEGRWSGQYLRTNNSVSNIEAVPRFQELCDRFQIKPTYLVDTPVATDHRSSEILAEIDASNRCEIGGHLHPWCTEPFDETLNQKNSFLCNLPIQLVAQKLATLGDQIEQAFGKRPTSFRAGRYGVGAAALGALKSEGYNVDSSVISFSNFANREGPNFLGCPLNPYWANDHDLH